MKLVITFSIYVTAWRNPTMLFRIYLLRCQ